VTKVRNKRIRREDWRGQRGVEEKIGEERVK
jgi:hypothetical protein